MVTKRRTRGGIGDVLLTTPAAGENPVRRLGTWAATAMVVSEVVGVGIFLTPATMARTLGSLRAALLVWFGMAALTLAGALCYTELATRLPRAGGAYVFLREGFGLRCAFVYGWMTLLVIDPGLAAALGVGLARYLTEAFRGSPDLLAPLAIACIVAFGLLTLLGVQASARIMQWTAGIKLLVVGVLVLSGIARATHAAPAELWPQVASQTTGPEGIAAAAIAAFFAFGGWWELGRMSEEVVAPRRTIPRALLGGVALVTAMYVLVTVAFMLVAGSPAPASDEAFVRTVGAAVFGEAAARALPALVAIAVSGTLAAVLLRAPRGYLAMARDGVFPRGLARFDARRGTCRAATLLQVTLASALVLVGTFDTILGYFVPTAVFFVGLSAAALLRLPRPAGGPSVFRMPWYPVPVVVFLLAVAVVLIVFAVGHPGPTLLGAAVVAVGMAVSRAVIAVDPAPAASPAVPQGRDSGVMDIFAAGTAADAGGVCATKG